MEKDIVAFEIDEQRKNECICRLNSLVAEYKLGKYMYDHLKLYLQRHSLIYMIDKLKMKREELENSIEKDKIAGIDVSKKVKILLAIDSEFFYYFSQWRQDQEQIT